jgi:hypothetical protein
MRRSGIGSGGGIGMNKHRDVRAPKAEPRARSINPSAVAQLGTHVGDKVTHVKGSTGYRGEPLVRGSGYSPPQGPTDNVAACGVGGGRTLYGQSGSQGMHGQPAPGNAPAKNHDILNDFGPDYRKP